ncbi:MAG: sulfurtransferase-like selenium metabolism protein YedF [Eubacteriales bacterium]|nr:sulfurtransferase-like selenium metabolism protein YedF [Eubacteriales bacterium]
MQEQKLDCLGMGCPMPVVKAKQALPQLADGEWLSIDVDGETQVQNLTRMAQNRGYYVEHEPLGENFTVRIQKKEQPAAEAEQPAADSGHTVIVFGSDVMGQGNEELGHILMKAFCFSVTQMDVLPRRMIFYNDGVKLTTKGSPVLEDLRNLAEAGVEIFSCGTCLKYLNLEDAVEVGAVSNMYEILEMQMQAAKVIKP